MLLGEVSIDNEKLLELATSNTTPGCHSATKIAPCRRNRDRRACAGWPG